MVWPITRRKSYVGETGKSMKVMGLAAYREDSCCNIAVTLIVGSMNARLLTSTIHPAADGKPTQGGQKIAARRLEA